jgi:hypothetical protein
VAAAASSSSSYSEYKYDLTTPQFTPDGRLLQVEYAAKAADTAGSSLDRGSGGQQQPQSLPLVVLAWPRQGLAVLVAARRVAVRRRRRRADPSTSTRFDGTSRSALERLVVLPGTASSTSSAVVLGLSGVVADSAALLRSAVDESDEDRMAYGPEHSLATPRRAAAAVADRCQRHAFGGGLRPYGSAAVACGLVPRDRSVAIREWSDEGEGQEVEDEEGEERATDEQLEIWQTDPSGALLRLDPERCPVYIAGMGIATSASSTSKSNSPLFRRLCQLREATPRVTLMGPSGSSSSSSSSRGDDGAVPLGQVIRDVHRILVEECGTTTSSGSSGRLPPAAASEAVAGTTTSTTTEAAITGRSGGPDGEPEPARQVSSSSLPPSSPPPGADPPPGDAAASEATTTEWELELEVDVAVISPATGAHKLAPEQVGRLLSGPLPRRSPLPEL